RAAPDACSCPDRPNWPGHSAAVLPLSAGPAPRFPEEMPSFATCVHRLERHETSITSIGLLHRDASFETAYGLYLVAFKIWLAAVTEFVRNRARRSIFAYRVHGGSHQENGGVCPAVLISLSVAAISATAAARSLAPGWPAPARRPQSTDGSPAPGCSPLPRWYRPASGWPNRSAAR